MELTMTTKLERIRDLNDNLRQRLIGGTAAITNGVAALGPDFVERVVRTIAVFDDFTTPTIRMPSTILARSRSTAVGCSSRSTTTIQL
jgi:hypothetical protein